MHKGMCAVKGLKSLKRFDGGIDQVQFTLLVLLQSLKWGQPQGVELFMLIGQGLKSLWALGHEERYIKANGQIAVSDPVAHDVRIVQAQRPFERVDLGK
jgi:hypothetical protein